MRHIEILSTSACARCVATKVELTQRGIDFTEVKSAVDPDGAADLMDRFAEANGGAAMTAPLVLVSDDAGEVLDSWRGRVDHTVDRISALVAT